VSEPSCPRSSDTTTLPVVSMTGLSRGARTRANRAACFRTASHPGRTRAPFGHRSAAPCELLNHLAGRHPAGATRRPRQPGKPPAHDAGPGTSTGPGTQTKKPTREPAQGTPANTGWQHRAHRSINVHHDFTDGRSTTPASSVADMVTHLRTHSVRRTLLTSQERAPLLPATAALKSNPSAPARSHEVELALPTAADPKAELLRRPDSQDHKTANALQPAPRVAHTGPADPPHPAPIPEPNQRRPDPPSRAHSARPNQRRPDAPPCTCRSTSVAPDYTNPGRTRPHPFSA
jgi:hypothetical protein